MRRLRSEKLQAGDPGCLSSSSCSSSDTGEEGRGGRRSSRGGLMEHQFSDAEDSEGAEEEGDEVDDEDEDEEDYDGDSTPRTRSRSTSPYPLSTLASSQPPPPLTYDLLGSSRPSLFGYFTTLPSIQITTQAPPPPLGSSRDLPRGDRLLPPPSSSMDEDVPSLDRLSSPGLDRSSCPSPVSPSSSPLAHRYLSPHRDAPPGHLSPQRELSPLRHISPKRDLGVAGGYRRDLSPRRGPLSLLSPTGRDYKRDLSPRGRPRGLMRAISPRRGLYHHHHLCPNRLVETPDCCANPVPH